MHLIEFKMYVESGNGSRVVVIDSLVSFSKVINYKKSKHTFFYVFIKIYFRNR